MDESVCVYNLGPVDVEVLPLPVPVIMKCYFFLLQWIGECYLKWVHITMTFTGEEGFSNLCDPRPFTFKGNNVWGKVYNVSRIGKDNLVSLDTSIKRTEDGLWNLEMMQSVHKWRISSIIGYIRNTNPESITHKSHTGICIQAYEKILGYIEEKDGKGTNYYEMMATCHRRTQRSLMHRAFSREDEYKRALRSTLERLHEELKGKEVRSPRYARRRWLTPLLLLITR